MKLVWILWALQIVGVSNMPYDRLWLITIGMIILCVALTGLKTLIQQKQLQREIEQLGDVKDDEAEVTLLTLILKHIAIK